MPPDPQQVTPRRASWTPRFQRLGTQISDTVTAPNEIRESLVLNRSTFSELAESLLENSNLNSTGCKQVHDICGRPEVAGDVISDHIVQRLPGAVPL